MKAGGNEAAAKFWQKTAGRTLANSTDTKAKYNVDLCKRYTEIVQSRAQADAAQQSVLLPLCTPAY